MLAAVSVVALLALAGQPLPGNPREARTPGTGVGPEAGLVLAGNVLYRSPDLVLPSTLAVVGDRLVVGDSYADHSLRALRRSDGALLRTFGRKGRGPREFETVLVIDAIDQGSNVMVFDPTLQRATWIDLDADFDGERWVADRSVQLRSPAMVLATAWMPDGFVGVGAFVAGRLAHMTSTGRLVRTTGLVPVSPAAVTRAVWTRIYQSRLRARPDRARIAVVSRFADRLEVYARDGTLMAVGERPYEFDAQDLRDDDSGAVRFGYLDLAATDSLVYALFSGRTREEGEAYLGDRIHVFDWEGNLVAIWRLDARLMAIAVTPDGAALYGVRHHPDPAVLVYRPQQGSEMRPGGMKNGGPPPSAPARRLSLFASSPGL